ncbi:cucurbitadienol 11-hydroxylase-like [Lycium ferocissimum]|uniref:cucurbitadienol 11-hydroxylase-like n=1 Tax=Lycium ferocissimum TaxID=112874 RepID=UPI002814A8EE|nr:cucurbitadienol 11-hydroxylase-like [Lycium ferocissimum]
MLQVVFDCAVEPYGLLGLVPILEGAGGIISDWQGNQLSWQPSPGLQFREMVSRWRNPKCNGVLPPGSMGFPLIGETLQLILPSHSLDLPPFLKNRIKRYGQMFKTNVAGRPVIISADPEFNNFILKQDGKLVETWSLDTFAEVFEQNTHSSRKYTRHLTLNHFGVEALKDKLLPQMENFIKLTLEKWSGQDSLEVKSAAIKFLIDRTFLVFSG